MDRDRDNGRRVILVVAGAIFWPLLVIVACLTPSCPRDTRGAPAPIPRPRHESAPTFPVGDWRMKWGQSPWRVSMHQGHWHATSEGQNVWTGWLAWDAHNRRLTVCESSDPTRGWLLRWSVVLDADLSGVIDSATFEGLRVSFAPAGKGR